MELDNSALIREFYDSFSRGDAEGMVNCYGDGIVFSDPAFGVLQGDDARNMWRMLLKNAKGNIKIAYSDVHADDRTGTAKWIAEYIFSKTGNRVVNKISAAFEFENGKIKRHADDFDLWNWSSQALGWKGMMLGWTGFMKKQIQQQARKSLHAFSNKKYHASE